MLFENIKKLVQYGLETGLIEAEDAIYTTNRLLELFEEAEYEEPQEEYSGIELEPVLKELLDEAHARGILKEDSIAYRDLFDTKIMGCLVPVSYTHLDVYKRQTY